MATAGRRKFEAVEDSVRENLREAATAPAGIRTSGADRLAALQANSEQSLDSDATPERAPELVVVEVEATASEETPAGTTHGEQATEVAETGADQVAGEPKAEEEPKPPQPAVATPNTPAKKPAKKPAARKPTPAGTLPPTPEWSLDRALDQHVRHEGRMERYTYTAPKGLLDRLRDLDLRAKAIGLPTVSRRELAVEVAERILNNPVAAVEIFEKYPWTKGGGQLQPIYPVELAQQLDRTLAKHRVRQPGPLIGVISEQVTTEIEAWITEKEDELGE